MLPKIATILSILMVIVSGKSLRKDNNFDVVCHDSEDGYAVFVPHPYDCSLYYECVNLTPVLMSCPAGLYFDSRIDICNWPEYVDCPEPTTTTTTTESITNSPVTKTTPEGGKNSTQAQTTTTTVLL